MNQTTNDILLIKNNVFTLTPVLMSFYSECTISKDNLFLSFLVFPIIFNEEWILKKQGIRSDSTLETWKEKNRLHMEGFTSRMDYFRDITLKCIQYAVDMEWISIEGCSVKVEEGKSSEWMGKGVAEEWQVKGAPEEPMSNAKNLNKLFNGRDVVDIYSTLGVKDIWKQE